MKSVKPFPKCLFWTMSNDIGKRRLFALGKQVSELAASTFLSGSTLLPVLLG